ncbi:MAG: hypothetical protein CO094_11900 [Anaerolineae bacterium CG_4_9_14_3_um_filter_57_17]|nr:PAS domain S-box protein [bacterium]NCT20269.1 PAS domain S-box protein [bacterium]PJB64682.1 MAG: hypothetical protein CO094_11900 [Anaerolineae bacterium CG_4_9_14_3_um_filter_57_17]
MKKFSSSIALRLTVWFLLLSLLPLVVMAVFVRHNVADAFDAIALQTRLEQAQTNASVLARLADDPVRVRKYVQASQPQNGIHFIVDENTLIVAHPSQEMVGASVRTRYGEAVLTQIMTSDSGSVADWPHQRVIGYAHVAGSEWVDVVEVSASALAGTLAVLTRVSSLQLTFSLIAVSLAGGAVIWVIIGAPLRKLTRAAAALGLGESHAHLNANEMKDELSVLARTINGTDEQIHGLVQGLEVQVAELGQAYTSLRQSEERFRAIFDAVNDAILVLGVRTGAIIEANPKFLEMFEYQHDEISRLLVMDLGAGGLPYTRRAALKALRSVSRHGPQVFEWRARSKNGREFWVEVNLRLATLDGQERMLLTLRNIDQRRRAEQIQAATFRIAQAGLSTGTLYEYFVLVHEILAQVLPAKNFMAAFLDTTRNALAFPYHFDERASWPAAHSVGDAGLVAHVLRAGEPMLLTPESIAQLGLKDTLPCVDWLAAPLKTTRGVLGVLAIRNYDLAHRLTKVDQETFAFLTAQIATSVERKLAEDALRQAETRWRTLMESAPQLIMTINRQGVALFVNHSVDGLTVSQQAGATIEELLPGATAEEKRACLAQVFSDRKSIAFEFDTFSNDAKRRWFSCTLTPVIDRGWVELAIFNATEITSLKEAELALRVSEEMYRSIVEQLTDGFALLDASGQILEWNRAMEEMTGILRKDILSKPAWKIQAILAPDSNLEDVDTHYLALIHKVLDDETGQYVHAPVQSTIRNLRGEELYIQQIIFPIRTETSARLGSLFRNVTQQKLAEDQIRQMNAELEQRVFSRTAELESANSELESFSYSISHDLRAPLRAIDGFARLLSDELGASPAGESARFIEVIRQNARQMGNLIDDLLAFSRFSRQPLNKQPVDCAALIQRAIEILEPEQCGHPVEISMLSNLPNCDGDPTLLFQVWVNLLSNAIKFSRNSHPACIQIGNEIRQGEVVYFVRDNGVGFDMRYADKLFGVFQRLHRAEEFEGTGVGLAIVHRIVRRHGGNAWAESHLGQGTTFYFSLPQ